MSEMPQFKMTVDEFLVWAEDQPGRHELVDGRIHAMAPERVRHLKTKGFVYNALARVIRDAGARCEVLPDGATVRIDRTTAFEPDALVRCGTPLDDDTIEVPDPLIVVEVLSPSTRSYDSTKTLIGYFTLPSLRHYLIVDPDRRLVVHHRQDGDGIATRILGTGVFRLDPPGLDIAVETLFDGK